MKLPYLSVVVFSLSFGFLNSLHAAQSVARQWDERALSAIRADTPHPPAQARNLFCFSVAMWDAWAAYDTNGAVGYVYHGKHTAADIAAARREAISYAAYRMFRERHVYSKTASATLNADDTLMVSLGYDRNNQSRDTSTPAGVGNSVYDAVSAFFINDGSRQTNGTPYPQANPPIAYPDAPPNQGGYTYPNTWPLATDRRGIDDGFGHTVLDPNHWQRLLVVNAVDQNGFPAGSLQPYLGAQWLGVRSFSMSRSNSSIPWVVHDPPPLFGTATHEQFRTNLVQVIQRTSQLSPDDGVTIDISPGAYGNNTLGANDGTGRPLNPATGMPYAPNIVKRGDFARVLAEFWADGPNSETPPGHWNVIANSVADYPGFEKRVGGGSNPIVDDLEWDVKVYFAVNAALHDAACAAWGAKRAFDGWRPITAIRYLGLQGQSSDSGKQHYNPAGVPLIPGVIEIVTPQMAATNSYLSTELGNIAILNWPAHTNNPAYDFGRSYQGVKWMPIDWWGPYQRASFVTPAFPGYISGHSTFSRSAAEVMAAITGTPFFPGGMGTFTAAKTNFLSFEQGPSETVQLQFATYYDAADEAGISRIYGGIHPPADDFTGRRTGSQVGQGVWALAQQYFDGSIATNKGVQLSIHSVDPQTCELRYNTYRGFSYKLQTNNPAGGFTDVAPFATALNTNSLNETAVTLDAASESSKLYRVLRQP